MENHVITGLLKIRNSRIFFADENAKKMIAYGQQLMGKHIEDVLPDYQGLASDNTSEIQIVFINGIRYILSKIHVDEPDPATYLTLAKASDFENGGDGHFFSGSSDSSVSSVIESIHEDIVIVDRDKTIVYVSNAFCENYDANREDIIGRSIYDLEKEKVFTPSAAAVVFKEKEEVTLLQKTQKGEQLVITAVPIFNKNGEISQVVSYSRDLQEFIKLKKQYEKLEGQMKKLSSEVRELRERRIGFPSLIHTSPAMKKVVDLSLKVAEADINLLITGDSGVGKNLVARLIHQKGPRKNGPFIEINCGAIPENLLESELFGYEAGAFTGASDKGKIGMFELAHHGSLFLDEIGELPLQMQVKLLKVIQDKTISRLGGSRSIKVDFRLISATNQDMEDITKTGRFRQDLFYRLNVVPIKIPPLRHRKEDIILLLNHFLEKANKRYKKDKYFSRSVVESLIRYEWPGNVRELQNVVERLVITSEMKKIVEDDLPAFVADGGPLSEQEGLSLFKAKELLEKDMVTRVYEKHKTTVALAAALGISQPTAVRKIKKYITDIHA